MNIEIDGLVIVFLSTEELGKWMKDNDFSSLSPDEIIDNTTGEVFSIQKEITS